MRIGTSTPVAYTSVTEDITTNVHIDWNLSCWGDSDGYCTQSQVDSTYPTSRNLSNILASMIEVVRWSGSIAINGHGVIEGYLGVPPWNSSSCTGQSFGQANGYDRFCVQTATSNGAVAHEMGHLVMKRLLNNGSGSLANGSACGSWSGFSEEKCAVSEGWAEFYYGATYWQPNAPAPYLPGNFLFEGDTSAGNGGSVLQCVSNGTNPDNRRGNAARWFWDLFDSTTIDDGGQDNANYSISQIRSTWDSFVPGTANRQAQESDDNGRNARDFTYYMGGAVSERDWNCLAAQDNL